MLVRASIGSLSELGIEKVRMLAKPTTVYILQYSKRGCLAGCKFCPQSATSATCKDYVSRIPWPIVPLGEILKRIKGRGNFARMCIQSIIKPEFENEILKIVSEIRRYGIKLPVSIALTPVESSFLYMYKEKGVDYIGVGLDAATPEIFYKIGKPYSWNKYINFIDRAVEIFGRKRVIVHLIFGLGEKIKDFVYTMKALYEKGCEVALFAFTPVRGTHLHDLPQPEILKYRIVQIARFMLSKNLKKIPDVEHLAQALLTSGCPGCNRPFYNETPRKIYNYPNAIMLERDKAKLIKEISTALEIVDINKLIG